MKRQDFVALGAFVAFAMFSVCPVSAQDDVLADDSADKAATEEASAELPPAPQEAKQRGLLTYFSYVRCDEINGEVQVLRSGDYHLIWNGELR